MQKTFVYEIADLSGPEGRQSIIEIKLRAADKKDSLFILGQAINNMNYVLYREKGVNDWRPLKHVG